MSRIRSERDWIEWVVTETSRPDADVLVGPGDDAAVLRPKPASGDVVVTVDSIVEGVHFDAEAAPFDIGWKAMAVNLSDIAAMGAVPTNALLAIAAPPAWGADRLEVVMRGILEASDAYGVTIVGGDFTASPLGLHVTVTLLGETCGVAPVRRSGARPGDEVYVTGPLGGSIRGRHLRFRPRVREGRILAERHAARAMMDISDGLGIDAARMARASGTGIRIDAAAVPSSEAAATLAESSGRSALEHALGDGEDFELLVALSPDRSAAALADADLPGLVRIGTIADGPSVLIENGVQRNLEEYGHEHPIRHD